MKEWSARRDKELRAAIKRGFLNGWIEEIEDPWDSLPCIGSMDNVNNRCEECPLNDICEDLHAETQNH